MELGSVNIDIDSCNHVNEDFTDINYETLQNDCLYFATMKDVELFVNKVAKGRLEGLMVMIGFYFDQPVNRIGTTGWEILESIIYGEDFVKKTLVRHSEIVDN